MTSYCSYVLSKAVVPPEGQDPEFWHMNHAIQGIMGELLELLCSNSKENTLEELTDLYFYFSLAQGVLNPVAGDLVLSPEEPISASTTTLQTLILRIEHLANHCKKRYIYGSDIEVRPFFWTAWNGFCNHMRVCGFTLPQLEQHSRDKLDKRYQKGFTTQESEERKDKTDAADSCCD